MSTIDLGSGLTVQRHHLPREMLRQFDEARGAFKMAQDNVRSWVKSLYAMQAPASFSGDIGCTAAGQSGRTYSLPEPGGALLVDERDTKTFTGLGFTVVSSQQPSQPRVGLIFLDSATGQHLRWDGSAWAPVTLQ